MYGWTDPNDPDGAPRRRQQPLGDEPTWLTDRPEPRSAYLFGDDPEQPADGWHRDQPTPRWQPESTATWQPERAEPTGRWQHDQTAPGAHWRPERAEPAAHRQPEQGEPGGRWSPTVMPTIADGRHRSRRRLSRPALIGAAAAATLVASLGVGAVALTGGGPETEPSAVDDTVAAAPVLPAEKPGATPAPPTPSAVPTTVAPTPSATRTTRPTPAPSRSTAASRRTTERSTSPTTQAPVSSGVSSQARQVVNLVNAERAKAGCGALSIDDKLTTAAQRHSQDQADHRNMSHTGSDGSNPGTRLDRVGYAWRTYGENVAWNQQTPAAVMDAWMNSSGHRANIVNCAFTEIGVGVASSNGPYWTQVFAAPR
ncbi:CAP domain-containing protein [Micromonospora sp. NPDC047074]|uniref:CAP domain-containing protein n=1 Tax=Micromonospora sp. NPDC047074 TaxID=3154339 RepID=UPI00340BD8B5